MTEALTIANGALTPLIALLALWIAFRQYQFNRSKLRLDLYEKRYKVFHSLMKLLSIGLQKVNVSNAELFEFLAETTEADFLFKPAVARYMREVYEKGNELHALAFKLEALPVGEERSRIVEQQRTILDWIGLQFDAAKKIFRPYLDFRNIK